MPAWSTVTIAAVRAEAAVARIEAAVATDSAEIAALFETLRAGVVAEVRAKIATGGFDLDADTATVPPEWLGYVCLRILGRLLARPGQPEESTYRLTEDQRTELERREADLAKVASGDLAVTAPTTPATSSGMGRTAAGLAIGGRSRRWDRDSVDGL